MKTRAGTLRTTSQDGFVSIFAVLIIMAILTLLTIGFSTITRQAQRRTLDNQLNTQAFYAAESGINDAARALSTTPNFNKPDCQSGGPPGAFNYSYTTFSGVGAEFGYTCVLVNSEPTSLVYDSVPVSGLGEPVVVPLEATQPINYLTFSWDSRSGTDPLPTNYFSADTSPILDTVSGWGNKVGILRIDLIPTSSLQRANMVNNSYTFFLYPTSLASPYGNVIGAVNGVSDQAGTLVTQCNNAGLRCKGSISLNGAGAGGTRYLLRMQSFYNPVSVEVTAQTNSASPLLSLINGQAVVDATGKASDVLRRVQVRLPLSPSVGIHEPFALLSADSVCKRLIVSPGTVNYDPSDSAPTTGSGACVYNN